ncbi:hypothetical protein ABZV91_08605 [Nocardia sp. NPDC004568]|uniref:hypothetical protein n=1 Tax=Nocardia sp. NPDC004568 TaxID=3154551 RepID=UPI0033A5D0BF
MRHAVRGGILVLVLVAAPVATATASAAGPLEPTRAAEPASARAAGAVCTMQYPPTLRCLLASLSAA